MRTIQACVLAGLMAFSSLAWAAATNDQAQPSGEAWLGLIDLGKYAESWSESSSLFKSHVEVQKWAEMVKAARAPLGAKASRKLQSVKFLKTMPGAPDGNYALIIFDSSFTNKASAVETLTMMDDGGVWRAAGYFIR